MGLNLYMLGLIVRDMPAALAFYRRLGLDIPDDSDHRSHVEIAMGNGMTFFLDSQPTRWDPGYAGQPADQPAASGARYPMILEFYLPDQATLEVKYAELTAYGHQGFRAPYRTSFGMCFAMVKDPDGNTILLSADAAPGEPGAAGGPAAA